MDKLSKEEQEWLVKNEKMIGHKLCYYKGDVETKLLEMESKLKQDGWISVENLPDSDSLDELFILLDINDQRGADVVKWNGLGKRFEDTYYSEEFPMEGVTHYKKIILPKPPTGE